MTERIVLLRHAEKASADGRIQAVDACGRPDPDELSVRGWQRAGALARLFAPGGGDLGVPAALFAGAPTADHPSRRSISTLAPLAERLGLVTDTRFARGQEAEVARAAAEQPGLVLIAWDHRHLPALAWACGAPDAPPDWPADCFDRLWILERDGARWRCEVRGQGLLAGDG